MSSTTIVAQAASSHAFYGFYLEGFERLLGSVRLRFTHAGTPTPMQPQSGIGLIIDDRRIWLAAGDNALIEEEALEWCDTYGVVNVLPEQLEMSPKLLPIGPGFGVRWDSAAHTAWYVLRASAALRVGPKALVVRMRDSLGYHRRRQPLARYDTHRPVDPRRLFFVATLWDHQRRPPPARARFIEAALSTPEVDFDGGFVAQPGTEHEFPAEMFADRSYDLASYLDELQGSVCTFNSPAVWNCLGWKLGENLALGKAIITTELDRVLPEPLAHGVHVHVVDDDVDAMREAIGHLARNPAYRETLQANARGYWERWLAPEVVAGRLLAHRV